MLAWFVAFGAAALISANAPANGSDRALSLIPVVMLVFGALLVCGGFFPEALKARRILVRAFTTG